MSKKLFVLLLASMLLVTVLVLVLALTGHEQLIVSAAEWVTRSISNAAKVLGTVLIVVAVALLIG